MALLFMDGFDHYATADVTKKWTSSSGTLSIGTAGRRSSGQLHATAGSSYVSRTFAATASWVTGFAFQVTSLPSSAVPIAALLDAGTAQVELRLNPDGTLSVTRNATAVTGGTSVAALATGAYNYIEWKVTIADSIGANSCKVRINGVDALTVTTGQDLKNTANANANQIRVGNSSVATNMTADWDDLYICDNSGSTNNDFLGDCRIDPLYPTSDGNYSQFTPSTGVTHYTLVDETAPNTSDYNEDATAGHRDSYGMGDLSALVSSTVYGLQVNAAVLKDDAGARTVCTMVRSNGTDADGATVAPGTTQSYISQVYETNPNGSVAWTQTSVNAMEAGLKVVA